MKPFACRTLGPAEQRALANAHKRLLLEASTYPVGTELSRCYGLDMQPLGKTVIGEKLGSVRITDQQEPYIAVHNHPSGMTFSPGDIFNFTRRDNMRMLSAVGNNGVVYAMEKSADFNRLAVQGAYEKMRARIEQEKTVSGILNAIDDFLKEAQTYGIQYYKRAN